MQRPRPIDWAMLGFLSLAWGMAFSFIAVGLKAFPPLTLVCIRLAVGALTLYTIMRYYRYTLPTQSRWWGRFTILAIAGNLIPFSLVAWGQTQISSGQAGLLMALMPISTMVLAHFFTQEDTLTARRISGVILGLLGVAVLIGPNLRSGSGGGSLVAQLAMLGATLAYATNAVYTKNLPSINTLVVATGSLIMGTIILLPVSLYVEQPWQLQLSIAPILSVIALGVISTGLATWVYFRVVSDCGPSFLSLISYMIPVIAFSAGIFLLGETAVPTQFLGLVLILLGIALSQSNSSTGQYNSN